MLALLAAALASPPGVCALGLYPAEDGRCTGVRGPRGDLGESFDLRWRPIGPDRLYVLLDTSSSFGEEPKRVRAVIVDGGLGVSPAPAPFADRMAWFVARPRGALVAVEEGGGGRVSWLDPATLAWTAGAPAPGDARYVNAWVDGEDRLWLIGVGEGRGVWRGTPNRWTAMPDLPEPRFHPNLLPGPIVCGGRVSPEPDAASVPGCLRWTGKSWATLDLGPEATWSIAGSQAFGFRDGERPVVVRLEGTAAVELPPLPARCRNRLTPLGSDLACLTEEPDRLLRYDRATGAARLIPLAERGYPVQIGATEAWLTFGQTSRLVPLGPDGPRIAADVEEPGTGSVVIASPSGPVAVDDQHFVRWDSASETLVAGPDLPAARFRPGFVALADGTLVVAGGSDGDGAVQLPTFRLAPGAAAWTPGPALPFGLQEPFAVSLDARAVLLVAGAKAVRWTPEAAAEVPAPPGRPLRVGDRVLSVAADAVAAREPDGTWASVSRIPQRRIGPALLATRDGGLVLAGGNPLEDADGLGTTDVQRMDGDGRWRQLAPLPHKTPGGWLVELEDGTILHAGGDGEVSLYDPAADRWARATPLGRSASDEAPLVPFAPGALVHLGGTLDSFVEVYRIEGARTAWPALPAER